MNDHAVCLVGRCDWADELAGSLRQSGYRATRCTQLDVASFCDPGDIVCMVLDLDDTNSSCAEALFETARMSAHASVWLVVRGVDQQVAILPIKSREVEMVSCRDFANALREIVAAETCEAPDMDSPAQVEAILRRRKRLTRRERQVMDLVVQGRLNKQIAADLGLSPKTIEVHRAHVMEKMQCGSLAGLVRCAVALEHLDGHVGVATTEAVPV